MQYLTHFKCKLMTRGGVLIALLLLAAGFNAVSEAAAPNASSLHPSKRYGQNPLEGTISPVSGMRHPGVLQSPAMLKALKKSLDAKDPERMALWKQMITCDRGRIDREQEWSPGLVLHRKEMDRAKWAAPGMLRYTLDWIMNGNAESEQHAIQMFNTWANCEQFECDPSDEYGHHRLVGGITFGSIPYAAELLMSSGTSWPVDEQEKFKNTWRTVFLPVISENRPYHFNGNWDLACSWSILASAVMLDDRELFLSEIDRLRNGYTNAQFSRYLLPSGQCQETGRDVIHSEMGLYFASLCAQIAWNQNIDLFEGEDYSLGRCYEYLALFHRGEDRVPYEIYNDAIGPSSKHQSPKPSELFRGDYRYSIYEMIYHHYRDYRNTELYNVKNVLEQKTRPEGPSPNVQTYSTLCFWNLDLRADARKRRATRADVKVKLVR
ncbi:alginate lyase family protein [Pontiellaceae bacterium B12227]|nr:alginate lyase family protein [Pontiellaceae bacterium B12227]